MPAALLLGPLLAFLLAFYVIPFGVMFGESVGAWSNDPPEVQEAVPTIYQYVKTFEGARTTRSLIRTFRISLISVVITFLLSYPITLMMLRLGPRLRSTILMVTFISLAASLVIRNYSWLVVLADQGPINVILVWLGVFSRSQRLIYNEGAIIVALVHYCMPFMILPIYGALLRIPESQWEAPRTLGAGNMTTLTTVVLPLSMPGIFGGTTLCFAICASAFVTPLMLGSPSTAMVSQVAAEQLLVQLNFPLGSAIIFTLTALTFLLVFGYALIVRKVLKVDV
jgi:ABC-type spermidine/putrescine transport system permease subunit I